MNDKREMKMPDKKRLFEVMGRLDPTLMYGRFGDNAIEF